jgi:predicted aspartyl protease
MKLKLLLILSLFVSADLFAVITRWQDVEIVNGRVIVEVDIAGVPAKALLDSGATGMVINPSFLKENSIPYIEGREYISVGAHGKFKSHMIKEIDVTIFGKRFPLRDVRAFTKARDYQLLIGLPFLKLMIVQIDYPNKRIRFFSHNTIDLKSQANVDIKHGNRETKLVASVELEGGEKVDLLYDTGSTAGLVIDHHFAEKRGWLEKYNVGTGSLAGIGNKLTVEKLRLPYLKLGPYVLEYVKAVTPKEKNMPTNYSQKKDRSVTGTRISDGAAYIGILGGDVFKHFVVTLDAKNALMHIDAPIQDDSASNVEE